MTYVIKNWDAHYEIAQSRVCNNIRWVAIPNKHDGKSYRRLTRLNNSPDIFAAWILMVQIASKMPIRGALSDEDGDLTPEDMSDMTGFPEEIFEQAIPALLDPKIGWMEEINSPLIEGS